MHQEPPYKASTKVGRTIRVTESLGPATAQVPDLSGGSLRRAQIALSARDLRVSTHARVPIPGIPHGQVIYQDPPAGTVEWPGAGVSLLLSAGPRPRTYIMPDLRRRPRETVERWIARRGLRLGRVTSAPAPGMPPGAVLDQRPLPGHPLDPGIPVALTVAAP
jgi:beta-lactam-binding protein with PASTA domain